MSVHWIVIPVLLDDLLHLVTLFLQSWWHLVVHVFKHKVNFGFQLRPGSLERLLYLLPRRLHQLIFIVLGVGGRQNNCMKMYHPGERTGLGVRIKIMTEVYSPEPTFKICSSVSLLLLQVPSNTQTCSLSWMVHLHVVLIL